MPRFVDLAATDTIRDPAWEEGETVTIRRSKSFGDDQYILGATMSFQDGEVAADFVAARARTLERMIVSWTFGDAAGAVVPVTADAIARLDDATATFILDEIAKRNPQRAESQKKGS